MKISRFLSITGLFSSVLVVSVSNRAQPQPLESARYSTSGVGQLTDISAILDQVDKNSAEKTRLEKEAIAIHASRSQTREALKHQTRVLYRLVRSGILALSGRVDAFMVRIAQVERLKHLVRTDIERIHQLDTRSQLVERRSAEVANELEQATTRLVELQKQPSAGTGTQGFSSPSRANQRVNGSGFRGQNEQPGFYGLRVVDAKPQTTFARQRGNLALPISGDFTVQDARREESEGPGLEFVARAGTTVRAAATGRVAFSDIYGSYGRLVILDHGENYYTIYGGLGNVEVRVGDDLSRGARIGTIAHNGSKTSLFFEIRRGSKALPPRSWLGL